MDIYIINLLLHVISSDGELRHHYIGNYRSVRECDRVARMKFYSLIHTLGYRETPEAVIVDCHVSHGRERV